MHAGDPDVMGRVHTFMLYAYIRENSCCGASGVILEGIGEYLHRAAVIHFDGAIFV
jgi:hypothetical protein